MFAWRLRINTPRPGWRAWLGQQLRGLAQRVDGLPTWGIDMQAQPALTRGQCVSALHAGVRTMEMGLRDLAELEAEDLVLQQLRPDLYENTKR